MHTIHFKAPFEKGTKVEEDGLTSISGVYASGDVVSGPSTVVEAMASGRRVARMIINAGIQKIYYQSGYADSLARELLEEAGIELQRIDFETRGECS